ncbi:hypothetical protein BO94DRAFT_338749 [Aspergillus sclerotioniger CBS 115572]|uniref:Uncharacterized protein n=1 Tax=Aspergillus sclerotioniger CBS 115572 TaxID=1450535 RepID=A0A317UW44_9EURO|nr:hypothetical protein BO94DRAFT_338749 [Aspergillus sclerotioniger CBS 115572]PWY65639.1 hypothetical protein BO94DRAFT_338749 [Aspergillus sclerotioniger CBS 115572]
MEYSPCRMTGKFRDTGASVERDITLAQLVRCRSTAHPVCMVTMGQPAGRPGSESTVLFLYLIRSLCHHGVSSPFTCECSGANAFVMSTQRADVDGDQTSIYRKGATTCFRNPSESHHSIGPFPKKLGFGILSRPGGAERSEIAGGPLESDPLSHTMLQRERLWMRDKLATIARLHIWLKSKPT